MGRKVLGLEVTAKAIKISLVHNGMRPDLLDCGIIDLSSSFSSSGAMSEADGDISAITLAVKETVAANKLMSKGVDSVALCVNNSQTVVRPISLPLLPDKELDAAVEYELSQSFPGVGKTHAISFKEYTRNHKEISGIVSFSPRRSLEAYRKLIDSLGYKHSYIDVISNCEAKAFSAFVSSDKTDAAHFLCDIGSSYTQFTVMQKRMVRHSRQIPHGDKALKEILCDKLGLNASDYESFRFDNAQQIDIPEADLGSIFRVVYSSIVEQLHQTIEFYNLSAAGQSPVSEVHLIGGGSFFPQLEEHFSSTLGIPVKMIQPSGNIKADQITFSRTFSAIGAAIRED